MDALPLGDIVITVLVSEVSIPAVLSVFLDIMNDDDFVFIYIQRYFFLFCNKPIRYYYYKIFIEEK